MGKLVKKTTTVEEWSEEDEVETANDDLELEEADDEEPEVEEAPTRRRRK